MSHVWWVTGDYSTGKDSTSHGWRQGPGERGLPQHCGLSKEKSELYTQQTTETKAQGEEQVKGPREECSGSEKSSKREKHTIGIMEEPL